MHVAVVTRADEPRSLRVYADNLCRELAALGTEIVPVAEAGPAPAGCDLVWDPGLCMRRIPPWLRSSPVPVVGSLHGLKAFALPPHETAETAPEWREMARLADDVADDWRWFGERAAAVVAVSRLAADEAVRAFGVDPGRLHVVHPGVDPDVFAPLGDRADPGRPYLLAVVRPDPVKNVDRLLAAYRRLPRDTRPALVLVVPPDTDESAGFTPRDPLPDDVIVVREAMPQAELARWYRGALALVVPSLRETFGLTAAEAMACGCPAVVTEASGCAEVAGDAVLRVDPRSVDSIADAMLRVSTDAALRASLRERGLAVAATLRWERSAVGLLRVFHAVLPAERRAPRMRKLEVTTTAGCRVGCHFCPQRAFADGYIATGAARLMEWDTYLACLDGIGPEVVVGFGGMSEPFQNPLCVEMVLHAKARGHGVEIFTTLVGLDAAGLERLLDVLDLRDAPGADRLFVHVPSVERFERIPLHDEHLAMLRRLLSAGPAVEFHYHGSRPHPGLAGLPLGGRLTHWAIHDRAHNETDVLRRGARKRGPLACVMNLEVNVLLPNGDVLICCQDFGAEHVIGNLLTDAPGALYASDGFRRFQEAMADDRRDGMCRHCHFAVELAPPPVEPSPVVAGAS